MKDINKYRLIIDLDDINYKLIECIHKWYMQNTDMKKQTFNQFALNLLSENIDRHAKRISTGTVRLEKTQSSNDQLSVISSSLR